MHKRDDYDNLVNYMELRYAEFSRIESLGRQVTVNFDPFKIAKISYVYGVREGFSVSDTKQVISGFIERKFGEKAAKRALARLEDK
jgi:hypothetical protein